MNDMTHAQIKLNVDAFVAAAALPLTAEDYERLLSNYPIIQSQLATLRMPESRYAEPAMQFRLKAENT